MEYKPIDDFALPKPNVSYINMPKEAIQQTYVGKFMSILYRKSLAVFDEENLDIRYNKFDEEVLCIYRFPEIIISNSKGESHTIRELFVKVEFELTYKENPAIPGVRTQAALKGTRGQQSIAESISSYMHSHLPSSSHPVWETFCQGDTIITDALSDFAIWTNEENMDIKKITEDENHDKWLLFELLLSQIPGFVSWESLEGVPFEKIAKISVDEGGSGPAMNSYTARDHATQVVEKLEENDCKIDFTDMGPSFYPRLIYTDQMDELAKQACSKHNVIKPDGTIMAQKHADAIKNMSGLHPARGGDVFSFRGRKITPMIDYGEKTGADMELRTICDIRVIDYAKQQLERDYFKEICLEWAERRIKAEESDRGTGDKQERSPDNKAGGFIENIVPVSAD